MLNSLIFGEKRCAVCLFDRIYNLSALNAVIYSSVQKYITQRVRISFPCPVGSGLLFSLPRNSADRFNILFLRFMISNYKSLCSVRFLTTNFVAHDHNSQPSEHTFITVS